MYVVVYILLRNINIIFYPFILNGIVCEFASVFVQVSKTSKAKSKVNEKVDSIFLNGINVRKGRVIEEKTKRRE